jgi:cytochrome c556
MRVRLPIVLAVVLAAGGAVAQIVDHDLPVQAIMATSVNPGALAFWAGGNDPPEGETKAEAAARWDEAVKGAQAMQAQGVALQQYSRPGRWNEFAQMMADISKEGEAVARAKDAEKAFEIGGRLYDSCNGCHKTYIPPPPRQQ